MNGNAISQMAKIVKAANQLITVELKNAGLDELSPSHGDILVLLYREDKISMHDIAKKIHRTKATTTVLIDKLEKAEFVIRQKSGDDSRFTNVYLTEKGRAFKLVFDRISAKLNSVVYKNLTESEAAMLESLLGKINI